MGGILFDNRYDSRMRHLRPYFQLEGGRPRREAWLKILDITSHGNIPVELTLNPIAGIFSALVDEHLDGNVFICSKRLRIISIASRCFLYSHPLPPPVRFVFSQKFSTYREDIFVPWRAQRVLEERKKKLGNTHDLYSLQFSSFE